MAGWAWFFWGLALRGDVHPVRAAGVSPPGGGAGLNFVRLSIGLEEPEVLIADLQQALAAI